VKIGVGWIPVIVAGVVVATSGVVLATRRKMGQRRLSRLYESTGGAVIMRICLDARSLGAASRGRYQLSRGGILALTQETLCFVGTLPGRVDVIPMDHVLAVSTVSSHAGSRGKHPLLHLEYRTETGNDAMAWSVQDPQRWVKAINKMMPGGFCEPEPKIKRVVDI
jgi:hypothetical protein